MNAPPRNAKAARVTDGPAFRKATTTWQPNFNGASGEAACITEGVSPARRLADLCGLERGLRVNLVRSYERGDWQGARNQIDALEKCRWARKALLP